MRPIVTINIQTTHLSVDQARIVELTAVKVLPLAEGNDAQMEEMYTLVRPPGGIVPAQSQQFHGISSDTVSYADCTLGCVWLRRRFTVC